MHSRCLLTLSALALALSLLGLVGAAQAQQFTKPVRVIVPYAAGGASDILARLIGPHLSKAIGQPVVVENKLGATGNIGADFVAKAEKDGHTLLLAEMGAVAAAPSLFTKLTYDPQKDLTGVGMLVFGSYILAVHPSVPVNTVAELVAYAKANPGKLAIANSGVGNTNHLTGILLAKHWGIDWKYVPYKGGAAAIRGVYLEKTSAGGPGAAGAPAATPAAEGEGEEGAASSMAEIDLKKAMPDQLADLRGRYNFKTVTLVREEKLDKGLLGWGCGFSLAVAGLLMLLMEWWSRRRFYF